MNVIKRSLLQKGVVNKECIRVLTTIKGESDVKPYHEIPGPSSLPVIGQIHHFFPGGSLFGIMREDLPQILFKTYGPIVKLLGIFGSPPFIFLFDPEAAMHIFRNEDTLPHRPGFQTLEYFRKKYNRKYYNVNEPTGLMTEQGELWKKFRSTVNPVMLQPKTIQLYADTLTEVADDMIKRMKCLRNEDGVIEKINLEMNLWSLESIGVVALGGRLNCLDLNLPDDSPVRKLIDVVHNILKIMEIDFNPLFWKYFSTSAFKNAMKHYEEQLRLNEYFVSMAIEKFKTSKPDPYREKGILEKLLEIDPKVAIIMASDMMFAGIDSTATTIIGLMYHLAHHPDKQNKLREEIMTSQGKRTYLRACIKESLRLMPVTSGIVRKTTKEYSVLGYKIPKDMMVIVGTQHMLQMREYYPKPQHFIPERWTADKNDPLYYGNTHPFVHTPFGFGVRSCIGRRIAELEIETFMTKLIQNFDVRWFGPPIKSCASTINYFAGPFNFIFNDV